MVLFASAAATAPQQASCLRGEPVLAAEYRPKLCHWQGMSDCTPAVTVFLRIEANLSWMTHKMNLLNPQEPWTPWENQQHLVELLGNMAGMGIEKSASLHENGCFSFAAKVVLFNLN